MELEGIKTELAKEDVDAQHFQKVVRDVAERAMAMQTQVEELHAEVKSMHTEIGTKLVKMTSSNDGLGKMLNAVVDDFYSRITKQDAEKIQALQTSMAALRASLPEDMSSLLASSLAPIKAQLNTLLENCYDLPTLISVWRCNGSAFEAVKKGDAMLLKIRFHCEYTLEPSSAAYEVNVTEDWVREEAKHTRRSHAIHYMRRIYVYMHKISNTINTKCQ